MAEGVLDKGLAGKVRGDLLNLFAVFSMIGAVPAGDGMRAGLWWLIAAGFALVGVAFFVLMKRFHLQSDLSAAQKKTQVVLACVLWGLSVVVAIVNFALLKGIEGWPYERSWVLLSWLVAFFVLIQVVSTFRVSISNILHYRADGAFAVFMEFVAWSLVFLVFAGTVVTALISWYVRTSGDLLTATIAATVGTVAWAGIEGINFLRQRRQLARNDPDGSLLSLFKSLLQVFGCLFLLAYLWTAYGLSSGVTLEWERTVALFWPGVALASLGTCLGMLHGYLSIKEKHGGAAAAPA